MSDIVERGQLRRIVLIVALLNFAYFFVEFGVAVTISSVSLMADSVDFLEDTAVNLLIFMALGWAARSRAIAGKVAAVIILVPALVAGWQAIDKAFDPVAPEPASLILAASGAAVVNVVCAWLLVRVRRHAGSLGAAAFLAARNDVLINLAIIAMGLLTWATMSGWPDIILGVIIIALNLTAAKEVWEVAEEEELAAKALAGEDIDD
ncbi:cation transporter [Corynebacterium marinum]|uniref:Co/Zn/Cd efflux system component n=2 Tax=Corynebacterium marinum TaxID=349751 RepID=A0A0B6TLC3_9CORY|nr:cation transporter [Corynebacterium marinum]AJK68743.1 Co/Zn/Cd efflux system component [Corynebacterium marinum DSM 44953]NLF90077.1 cation transporter [Corynebacterium marinum]GGO13703.1 cobalt transporter [Corynebacterium marinum]